MLVVLVLVLVAAVAAAVGFRLRLPNIWETSWGFCIEAQAATMVCQNEAGLVCPG